MGVMSLEYFMYSTIYEIERRKQNLDTKVAGVQSTQTNLSRVPGPFARCPRKVMLNLTSTFALAIAVLHTNQKGDFLVHR